MKRLILSVAAALLLAVTVFGQDKTVNEIISRVNTDRISFNYSCTVMEQQVPIKLDGDILVQGNCYYACGNGLEIYCDGKTRWTVDREAKEVYIEKSGGIAELVARKDDIKNLKVSNVSYKPLSSNMEAFTFPTGKLDRTWVVTDLREE